MADFKTCLPLLFVGACMCAPAPRALTFRSLDRGIHTGVGAGDGAAPGTVRVARTATEWTALWTQHESLSMPAKVAPEVDFERDLVVLVENGSRPTAGYALSVREVRVEQGALVIVADESSPAPHTPQAQVVTHPYEFIAVQRQALPLRVIFEAAR